MNPIKPKQTFQAEPVRSLGALTIALVVAGIALLPLFGVSVTIEQQTGLATFATALIAVITELQRSRVTPVK